MSDNVGCVIFWWGMIENVGVAAEIALLSCPSQKLFLVPVRGRHFENWKSVDVGQCRKCPYRVGSDRSHWICGFNGVVIT